MATMEIIMMAESETTSTNPQSPALFHHFLAPRPSFLEKQVGSQSESMSCYGPKSELSMSEVSNRFVGSKRRHSDSTFTGTSREEVPQMIPETSHVMKMICSSSGGERVNMPPFDRPLYGMPHQFRPVSSFTSQTLAETNNANFVNSERLIPVNVGGSSMQDKALVMKSSPHVYQVPSNRFRDVISGPSVMSHLAADEGSITGNKVSGVLSSIDARNNPLFRRNPSGSVTHNLDPESSNPRSSQRLVTSSKQMTIIYGGRVHVFDDVYPNKADVIMSLAGSNGGCWSTSLPKCSARMTMNNSLPSGGNIAKYAGMSGQPSASSLKRNWEV